MTASDLKGLVIIVGVLVLIVAWIVKASANDGGLGPIAVDGSCTWSQNADGSAHVVVTAHLPSGSQDMFFITPKAVLDGGQTVSNGSVYHDISTTPIQYVKDIPVPPGAVVVGCNWG